MEKLREKCKSLIKIYENDNTKLKKLNLINEILKDEYAFFKIDINTAMSILTDLDYLPEEKLELYGNIISSENYLKYKSEDID